MNIPWLRRWRVKRTNKQELGNNISKNGYGLLHPIIGNKLADLSLCYPMEILMLSEDSHEQTILLTIGPVPQRHPSEACSLSKMVLNITTISATQYHSLRISSRKDVGPINCNWLDSKNRRELRLNGRKQEKEDKEKIKNQSEEYQAYRKVLEKKSQETKEAMLKENLLKSKNQKLKKKFNLTNTFDNDSDFMPESDSDITSDYDSALDLMTPAVYNISDSDDDDMDDEEYRKIKESYANQNPFVTTPYGHPGFITQKVGKGIVIDVPHCSVGPCIFPPHLHRLRQPSSLLPGLPHNPCSLSRP
uniref:(California timema) hypothetical protein n=1 Tax=Timema californicum TaxID=61474 RepID=A0A7R9J8X0_TIMCA|nr:unnamed protein product [Timema californicum]